MPGRTWLFLLELLSFDKRGSHEPAITVWEIKCGSVKDTTFMQGQRQCLFPTAYLHDVN